MSWLIPRSMSGLVAAGYLLAAAPLVLAIVLSTLALERLAGQSERLVHQSVTVARQGARLREELVDLERSARQFVALGNPELLDLFAERRARVDRSLASFAVSQPIDELGRAVARVERSFAQAMDTWEQLRRQERSREPAIEDIRTAVDAAEDLIRAGAMRVDAEVDELQAATREARTVVILAIGALIPLAVLLALGLTGMVTRPLRRAGEGIEALGHARYAQPIEISYPSEMRALGVQLDWLRQRLAQLEADKDRFLRHVTHELKTPLASLREGVTLLRDGSLGPLAAAQTEVASILDESARELEQMIVNLLAYAQWRQERDEQAEEWFPIRPMLKEILAARKLLLAARGLKVRLNARCDEISGQPARIREVLDNLVGNAIKHAPQGSRIDITVSIADAQCHLAVRDYGRGVSPEARQRIFEPFVRGEEAEETGARGTGVGLAIVRETLIEHQGTVEVEDAQPGARFKLVWPVLPAA